MCCHYLSEWMSGYEKAPPLGRGEPTQWELNPQTAKARPAGTRVGRCCALPEISRQRRHRSQVNWILERYLSGVIAILFSHVQKLEARVAQAATGWHTGCSARKGRKAPQDEDLASIDTVQRFYSTGSKCRNTGAAQSRGACRTRTHTGPAPARSVLGLPCQSLPPLVCPLTP